MIRQDTAEKYKHEIVEMALIPVKRLKDKLLWHWPGYQDKYWQQKIKSAKSLGHNLVQIDRQNHQIIVMKKEK